MIPVTSLNSLNKGDGFESISKCLIGNRFPKKKICNRFTSVAVVVTSYLNTGMCKFESSQKESRAHSADSSKDCSKPKAFNFHHNCMYFLHDVPHKYAWQLSLSIKKQLTSD